MIPQLAFDVGVFAMTVLGAACGGVASWAVMRVNIKQVAADLKALVAEQKELTMRVQRIDSNTIPALSLHMSEVYVKKDDLKEMEGRLLSRIDRVDETVGQTMRDILSQFIGHITPKRRPTPREA